MVCNDCPTGSFSPNVGATDLSNCYPCPQGRVCGDQMMYNLSLSTACPQGYLCGFSTDLGRQFMHPSPAGFWTPEQTVPGGQFDNLCDPGFFCEKGTSESDRNRARCPIGSFCPESTPSQFSGEIRCPKRTTTLSGASVLESCRINAVHVCDKLDIDVRKPMEDITYYPQFSYNLLDDSAESFQSFDSSLSSSSPTGEIEVVRKVMSECWARV